MQLSDFDYSLPPHLIAQQPLATRGASRMLCVDGRSDQIVDSSFSEFESLLDEGDLLVLNDTRVIPARLYGQKQSGGKVEVMVERVLDEQYLLAHIRSSKSPKAGTFLSLEGRIDCFMQERRQELFLLRQQSSQSWFELLEQYGHIPLPPYIERADDDADRSRYQTVFAQNPGAVAAPTAGLHFDQDMLARLQQRGIKLAYVTLHVGAGTFQPVRGDNLDDHIMHAEWVDVSDATCKMITATQANRKRVVAVGTTVVRSLECAAREGGIKPFRGDTKLFIKPGFEFNVVDAMLTNFHLPKSTLLLLVSAFAGTDLIRRAYLHAVEQEYRFFSYGDAMYINKAELGER